MLADRGPARHDVGVAVRPLSVHNPRPRFMTPYIVAPEVAHALTTGQPVVALESTIISHGLPRPRNLQAAIEFEQILRSEGVIPATVAVLDGIPRIGLDAASLARIAHQNITKASIRDLPILVAKNESGATTVAATAQLARRAGIRVFATGGLGGVHRGAAETFDESADLMALSASPITVVCAGIKSVLDIAATLERLETLSIPVIGYKTREFPAFWLTRSGHLLDWCLDSAEAIARAMQAQDALGHSQAMVVANPIPVEKQWQPDEHDRALNLAFDAARKQGITGKAVTPFLLSHIVEQSNGRSLEVNLDLVRNNISVAAQIAKAWSGLR